VDACGRHPGQLCFRGPICEEAGSRPGSSPMHWLGANPRLAELGGSRFSSYQHSVRPVVSRMGRFTGGSTSEKFTGHHLLRAGQFTAEQVDECVRCLTLDTRRERSAVPRGAGRSLWVRRL
jgi:hypothetical protein